MHCHPAGPRAPQQNSGSEHAAGWSPLAIAGKAISLGAGPMQVSSSRNSQPSAFCTQGGTAEVRTRGETVQALGLRFSGGLQHATLLNQITR